MSYQTIELSVDGPVGTLRLNRPERMNAVIEAMYREIGDALERTSREGSVRCLILTGSVRVREGVEKQAFCAGADLKEHASGRRSREQQRAYIELAHETVRAIWEHPKPIVAALNGPARGAGAEMAIACDFVLMAEDATLAFPETGLGTFVGGGATHVLPRLVGLPRARELVYTGRVVDGREAVEIGLALRCLPLERLLDEAKQLARRLAARAPIPMTLAKRYLQRASAAGFESALSLETEAILTCMESADWKEGLRAFAEGREPDFKGS